MKRYHLHISNTKSRKGRDAKIWLDNLEVFEQGDLSMKDINLCIKLLKINKQLIIDSINNFARGIKQKSFELKIKRQNEK